MLKRPYGIDPLRPGPGQGPTRTVAMTQPIRINDVVIVEGEWGTIE
jgi:hypothetical protein